MSQESLEAVRCTKTGSVGILIGTAARAICLIAVMTLISDLAPAQTSSGSPGTAPSVSAEPSPKESDAKEEGHEFWWERPGTVSIYDLQFGPAELKDNHFQFTGSNRTFSAGQYGDRLILLVRFSYRASRREIPLKFVIRLPEARQYEETIRLPSTKGSYDFHFTVQRPGDFVGTGFVYLYYGVSIVDVLDFTIMPAS